MSEYIVLIINASHNGMTVLMIICRLRRRKTDKEILRAALDDSASMRRQKREDSVAT